MKPALLAAILAISSMFAGITIYSRVPRRLVLGWLGVGVFQSLFILVVGFEFLALMNLFFAVASATVLQLYSALFGTEATFQSEKNRTLKDAIYGIGAGATVVGILTFALVGTIPEAPLSPDLETPVFAKEVLTAFPELPWILGVILFLAIVVWASVGRPGWKFVSGSKP